MASVQNKAKQYKQQDDMKLREYETKPNNTVYKNGRYVTSIV